MAVNLLTVSEVSVLRGMKDEERPLFFRVIAQARRLDMAAVEKAYGELLDKAAEHEKANAAKVERDRKAKLVDTLKVDTEAFRFGTTAANGNVHDLSFLEELRERAEGFGVLIVYSGVGEDNIPRFTVSAAAKVAAPATADSSATRGGGSGAGRPSADAPQPYLDAETGERVTGPVTMWLRNKVSVERLKAAGLLKDDGKLKGSGGVIAAAAVKAAILLASPVPEASEPAAPVAPESPAPSVGQPSA
jgi:hypothetical protein